jgi:hypothetical protein
MMTTTALTRTTAPVVTSRTALDRDQPQFRRMALTTGSSAKANTAPTAMVVRDLGAERTSPKAAKASKRPQTM